MPVIRCENINSIHWAYVTEYAKKRRLSRCDALEKIIEEHIRFTAREHERRYPGSNNVIEKAQTTKKK
jgi:hypothetical protein